MNDTKLVAQLLNSIPSNYALLIKLEEINEVLCIFNLDFPLTF